MAEYAEKENAGMAGRGGPHNGGGHGPDANTLVASFTYLDTLGTLAEVGNAVLLDRLSSGVTTNSFAARRRSFSGETCDFEPRPDYWVAFLWNRLMGSRTLAPLLVPASNGADDVECISTARQGRTTAHSRSLFRTRPPRQRTISPWCTVVPRWDRVSNTASRLQTTDPFASRDLLLNGEPLSTGPPPAVVPQIPQYGHRRRPKASPWFWKCPCHAWLRRLPGRQVPRVLEVNNDSSYTEV